MLLMGGTQLGEQAIPGFEAAIENATGAKSDYEGLEKFYAILSYYTGLKYKPVDVKTMKEQLKKDIYYSAREKRAKDVRRTEASIKRSAQYRKREDKKIRRLVK
jgi:hypothetical protein